MIDKDLQTSLQFPRKGLHVLCCFFCSCSCLAPSSYHKFTFTCITSHHHRRTEKGFIYQHPSCCSLFLPRYFFLLGMLNAIIMKRKKNRVCLAFYTLKHYGKENNACIFKATPITEQKNMKLCKITEFCHRFRNALYLNTDNM